MSRDTSENNSSPYFSNTFMSYKHNWLFYPNFFNPFPNGVASNNGRVDYCENRELICYGTMLFSGDCRWSLWAMRYKLWP